MIKFEGTRAIIGVRTNLSTKVYKEIPLHYYVYLDTYFFNLWFHLETGVTGYESFNFNLDTNKEIKERGWCACFGTEGSWDRLEISAEQMKIAIDDMETVIKES